MRCRKWRNDLTAAATGTLDEDRRPELDEHLGRCAHCTEELRELEVTLDLVHRHGHREPLTSRLDHFWTRLEPQLDDAVADRAPISWWSPRLAATAAAMAAAVAIAAGIWLVSPQHPAPVAPQQAQVEENIDLDDRYRRYLRRSKPLLIAVANRDSGALDERSVDSSSERELALSLAEEGAVLSEELRSARRRREHQLTSELQHICLQLANLSGSAYADGLELVQDSLEQRSILFQVSRHELRLST